MAYNINMKRLLFLLHIIFIFSCSNLSLETESISVETVKTGSVFEPGDIFNITYSKTRDSVAVNPSSVKVVITYNNELSNNNIFVEPIELSIDLDENPSPQFKITDEFIEGLYNMDITFLEKDTVLTEHSTEFIVYSGSLSGEILSVYPLDNIYENSKILLNSKISYDKYIDPYLIWELDNNIISEGYLSEGFDSIVWDTEERNGFIDISLNLSPYKIDSKSLTSDNIVSFSFIVNSIENTMYNSSLLSHYSKLLSFNGNYIDEVNKSLSITTFGDILPNNYNNFYGMEVGSKTGFSTPDTFFSGWSNFDSRKNFSLILDFQPLDLTNGVLITSSDGGTSTSLFVEGGVLKHSFSDDFSVDITNIYLDKSYKVVLSFVMTDHGYNILYYINGDFIKSEMLIIEKRDSNSLSDYKVFQVGGDNEGSGFNSLIGELGIYYLDDLGNNNIYPNNLKDEINRNDFKIIEDFNSVYSPINLIGAGSADGEHLSMESDSSLTYINSLPINSNYTLEIKAEGGYLIELFNETDTYQQFIHGSTELKKKGSITYINSSAIENLDVNMSSFKIISQSDLVLDYIILESMDFVLEE